MLQSCEFMLRGCGALCVLIAITGNAFTFFLLGIALFVMSIVPLLDLSLSWTCLDYTLIVPCLCITYKSMADSCYYLDDPTNHYHTSFSISISSKVV